MLRAISTFAGIGGFDLALERAGATVVAQIENAKSCLGVLRYHYPDVPKWGDIQDVRPNDLPPADLICGGFPCQDLSVAGNRAGLAGERSGLFFELLRLINALTPQWIFLENVDGLLSSHKGRDMGAVLTALGNCGYGVAYRVFDAQYFGTPQRRRRVFFVGYFGDPRPAAHVLFESQSLPRDSNARLEAQPSLTSDAFHGVDTSGKQRSVAHAVTTQYGRRFDPSTETYIFEWSAAAAQSLNPAPIGPTLRGNNQPALYQCQGTNVGPLGTLRRGNGSITGGVPFLVATHPRRATPKECERLQGFPDNWTRYFTTATGETRELKDTPRYKMLGNALAVPVAEWIARRLVAVEATP